MANLPTVGGDQDTWGDILNTYLLVSHTAGGRMKPLVVSYPYSSSITPNVDTTEVASVGALTGNISVANPTGTPIDGQILTLRFAQDSTGSRTVSWGTAYAFDTSSVAPIIPSAANAIWEISFRWNVGTSLWDVAGTSVKSPIPAGGSTGQVLSKVDNGDYNLHWSTAAGGGGTATGWINVKDSTYGAVGDGTTNDTTAIQNAIAAVPSTGGVLYFPPGTYLVTGSLTLSNKTSVKGCAGKVLQIDPVGNVPAPDAMTNIITSSPTLDVFIVNANGCSFDDIAIFNTTNHTSAPVTAGHGILVNSGQGMSVRNCSVFGFFNNMEIINGYGWIIRDSFFFGAKTNNLVIADVAIPDAGDAVISGCSFYTYAYTGMTHLLYKSGGGLKISDCKFNSGGQNANWCIDMPINAATVDFLIENCSLENFSGGGIRCMPTSAFGDIKISGCQINDEGSSLTGNLIQMGGPIVGNGAPSSVLIDDCKFTSSHQGSYTFNDHANNFTIFSSSATTTVGKGNQFTTVNKNQNIMITPLNGSGIVEIARLTTLNTIAYASTIVVDMDYSMNHQVKLTGDATLGFFLNGLPNDTFCLRILQDSTGGRNLSFEPNWFESFTGIRTINKAPNGVTIIRGVYDTQTSAPWLLTIENYHELGDYTTTQKNALITAATVNAGDTCYDITLNKKCVFTGTAWETITSS